MAENLTKISCPRCRRPMEPGRISIKDDWFSLGWLSRRTGKLYWYKPDGLLKEKDRVEIMQDSEAYICKKCRRMTVTFD